MCPDQLNNVVGLESLKSMHLPPKRLFGLDLGTKTIGIALSDGTLSIANPLETIRRTKFSRDVALLSELAARHDVYALIIGLPLNMNGTEGPRAQSTRAFVRNLRPLLSLPVAFWDERLSTIAAERAMLEADMSRKKRAEKIDATAAGIILQGALDRMRNL